MTSRCQGPFPPHPFFKGKALGTRLTISDLVKNLIPYFRPEALEPGAWPERVTSCYGTYTVVGVNIKREMVLSPNDGEVANSSIKHTQFKTRVHKPYPISDPNGRNWYPISDQNGWKKHTLWRRPYSLYKGLPPGVKNPLQITSLAAYASECNQLEIWLFQSRSQECTHNDYVLCWQTTLHWNINTPFAWWRHFTTMTRILEGFAFLCKLGLLLFKPHWSYQIYISKEKRKEFWS